MTTLDRVALGLRVSPETRTQLAALQTRTAKALGLRHLSQSDLVERLIQREYLRLTRPEVPTL